MALVSLSSEDLDWMLEAIELEAGVIIQTIQKPMVESRFAAFCKSEGEPDPRVMVARCKSTKELQSRMVGALTNGETSFFRDPGVFQAFVGEYLPRLMEKNSASKTLRLWSAACSSGQEPYTLAMLLAETPALEGWNWKIIASDISQQRLAAAESGLFTREEVNRGLPARRLLAHFDAEGDRYRVKQSLRSRLEFRRINLLDSWGDLPRTSAVFLRNAMIYWAPKSRVDVLARVEGLFTPGMGGLVVLGSAESPLGLGARVALSPTGHPGIYVSKDF